MLVSERGIPLPPQDIVQRLQEIDPDLGMKFLPGPQWAITLRWSQEDPRRVLVRKGDVAIDQAHDVWAVLPADCSPEQAYGYVIGCFKQAKGSGSERAAKLLDRVHMYNKQVQGEARRPVEEYAQELLEANASTLFRNEGKTTKKFFMTEPGPTKRKGREL